MPRVSRGAASACVRRPRAVLPRPPGAARPGIRCTSARCSTARGGYHRPASAGARPTPRPGSEMC
ncbi:hypothetical protein B6E66_20585 [Streptomyces maremycinicus]|nr:hypothetical protein B6E66_20585 [Streptomyces sp. B9173]